MKFIIHEGGRAQRAVAEAINGFQCDPPVGRSGAELGTQRPLGMGGQRLAADRLARLSPAQLDDMTPRRCLAEVVIEAKHAVNFGARQVERVGDMLQ